MQGPFLLSKRRKLTASECGPKGALTVRMWASAASIVGRGGHLPTYAPMRASDTAASSGPTSFSTSFFTGEPGKAVRVMPIRPPIEVPTQCTVSTTRRAISATMSLVYTGTWYSIGLLSQSESPREGSDFKLGSGSVAWAGLWRRMAEYRESVYLPAQPALSGRPHPPSPGLRVAA